MKTLYTSEKAGWAFWQDDKSDGSLDQLLAKFILNSYESTDEKTAAKRCARHGIVWYANAYFV